MIVIGNAFSINMLTDNTNVKFNKMTADDIKKIISDGDIMSIVGHPDTAAVFSNILGTSVPMNRCSWQWTDDKDILIIGQLTGPRLPEGATTLPDGATINWWVCTKN